MSIGKGTRQTWEGPAGCQGHWGFPHKACWCCYIYLTCIAVQPEKGCWGLFGNRKHHWEAPGACPYLLRAKRPSLCAWLIVSQGCRARTIC